MPLDKVDQDERSWGWIRDFFSDTRGAEITEFRWEVMAILVLAVVVYQMAESHWTRSWAHLVKRRIADLKIPCQAALLEVIDWAEPWMVGALLIAGTLFIGMLVYQAGSWVVSLLRRESNGE